MSKRIKVDGYPGVYYRIADRLGGKGEERVYYVVYKNNGKVVEAKAGRQYKNDMTPARAARYRSMLIEGREKTPQEKRDEKAQHAARWTIEKLWEKYSASKSQGPNRTDKCNWEKHLSQSFSKKEPAELVKLDTDRLRINLLKKKSPQTVRHILALLRRIINFGVDSGLCPPLPFKISMPSVDNIKTEDLTPKQIQRLLEVLDSTHLTVAASMMKLALYTGMRRGEIFKLRWQDLDFNRGFIHIVNPKGGKSQKIPMNQSARDLLKSIQKNDSEYVFPARNGGPRKDINKDANKIKQEAELPKNFRPFHGLRHVYATMLASSGKVDMFTLQKLLTHKSPQMTQRYAHFRDEAMQRASNTVDDILSDAMQPSSEEQQKNGTGK